MYKAFIIIMDRKTNVYTGDTAVMNTLLVQKQYGAQ